MINRRAKCIFSLLTVFFLCVGGNSPECDSWSNIQTIIENHFKNVIKCNVRDDCNGLDCDGKYRSYNFKVAAEIDPCKKPPVIDMILDVPNTKIRNVTHSLKDGDQYKLPDVNAFISLGIFVDVSLKEIPGRKLNVELKVKADKMAMKPVTILSNCTIVRAQCVTSKVVSKHAKQHAVSAIPTPQIITTKKCKSCNETEECIQMANGDSVCECKKGYTRDEFNVCNEVMLDKPGRICSMMDLKGCDVNEICKADYIHSTNGTCICLPEFHEDEQNHCVEGVPAPKPEPESRVSLVLYIVIPVCFLLLIAACVFVMIKQKVVQRLRDRFTSVTRYEIVSIGNDDEDDEPLVVS